MKHIKYNSISNHYMKKNLAWGLNEYKDLIPDTRWCVQEKIHGANVSFIFQPNEPIRHFSRTDEILGNSFYNTGDLISHYDEYFKLMHKSLAQHNFTVRLYGEIFGPGIQKGVDYGDIKRIMFYDMMIDDMFISQLEAKNWFTFHGLNNLFVNNLAIFDTLDEAIAFDVHQDSTYSSKEDNICEGGVIKPYDKVLIDDKTGRLFYLKNKNPEFGEKQKKKKTPAIKQRNEVVEWHDTFLSYIHKERLESVFSKEGRIEDLTELGKFIPLIMLDASSTFFEEEEFPTNEFDKKEHKYIFNAAKEIVKLLKEEMGA